MRIFEHESGILREYSDWLVQHRLEKWQWQIADAARTRNALAHEDKELLSEATRDEADSQSASVYRGDDRSGLQRRVSETSTPPGAVRTR